MTELDMQFLGPPEVRVHGRLVHFRTRKALALLAYLAHERRAARDTLLELLWTEERQGRSALRNTLFHLRTVLGPAAARLTTTTDAVALDLTGVTLDVMHLRQVGPAQALEVWRGTFLEGLSIRGAPVWDHWATEQAATHLDRYDLRLAELVHDSLSRGEVRAALPLARQRVRINSLNEDAYALLIRAQLAASLPHEAQATYRTCAQVLRDELGVRPTFADPGSPRSVAVVPLKLAASEPALVLPPLIGREGEWARLEQAWDEGKIVFLVGEAGVGKTRLAREFLNTRGVHLTMEGRPTDVGVPFAVARRFLRHGLSRRLLEGLPEFVRQELSRIEPTLWPSPLPPLQNAHERVRLFDAYVEFMGRAFAPRAVFLVEDLHHWDLDSHELGAYGAAYGPERGVFVQSLVTYRPEELSPAVLATILPVVELGVAEIITLRPLEEHQVSTLVQSLDPQADDALATRLYRFTGGNPLFVLETLRLLQTQVGLEEPGHAGLPHSWRVTGVIERRLSQLSRRAQQVLHLAAIAGPEFSLPLAVDVMNADRLDIAAAFEELHQAGVLNGDRFAHELMADVARERTPPAVRVVLHARLLERLASQPVPAALLAQHAEGARRWDTAIDHHLQAQTEAQGMMSLAAAEGFGRQAHHLRTTHRSVLRAEDE